MSYSHQYFHFWYLKKYGQVFGMAILMVLPEIFNKSVACLSMPTGTMEKIILWPVHSTYLFVLEMKLDIQLHLKMKPLHSSHTKMRKHSAIRTRYFY